MIFIGGIWKRMALIIIPAVRDWSCFIFADDRLVDRMLVIGPDSGSVEAAMKHSAGGSSELAATRNFQNASAPWRHRSKPLFYLDPALVYARFDTSLRPLLAMGAAFLPALSDTIDVSKLPPAEIVARHISPTVMSQSYRGDGYVAESSDQFLFIKRCSAQSDKRRRERDLSATNASWISTTKIMAPPAATAFPSPTPASSPK